MSNLGETSETENSFISKGKSINNLLCSGVYIVKYSLEYMCMVIIQSHSNGIYTKLP